MKISLYGFHGVILIYGLPQTQQVSLAAFLISDNLDSFSAYYFTCVLSNLCFIIGSSAFAVSETHWSAVPRIPSRPLFQRCESRQLEMSNVLAFVSVAVCNVIHLFHSPSVFQLSSLCDLSSYPTDIFSLVSHFCISLNLLSLLQPICYHNRIMCGNLKNPRQIQIID